MITLNCLSPQKLDFYGIQALQLTGFKKFKQNSIPVENVVSQKPPCFQAMFGKHIDVAAMSDIERGEK